jgi:chromosome partitioning protein
MQTIVWNSQKGGSGKTSLCAHVSVEAERAGDGPVYLIDTDRQGTLSTWHEGRAAERPHRIELPTADLFALRPGEEPENYDKRIDGELSAMVKMLDETHGAAFCMIDTAPTRAEDNPGLFALFRLADLVLVPVRPSPSDLWAVAATVKLLKQIGTRFLFVVNQATLNANITAQAVAALSHHGPVAQTIIANRVPYAAAMTDGHTAPELAAKGPAATEIAALWANIKSCLHASMPTTKDEARA